MDKLRLRKLIKDKLGKISSKEKKRVEQNLIDHLLASAWWNEAKVIGITISFGVEWNTYPLIEAAWDQGKLVCVPKCKPKERKLTFYQLHTYDQLEVMYSNLLEPKPAKTKMINKQSIDLLIVPGLLFDKNGFRIGFGGGYFDRYLSNFPNETVSLISKRQLVDILPRESFDIPVKHLITESGIRM